MGFLFPHQQPPKRINNIPVTQSSQGYPVPVGWGTFKARQSILYISPFSEQPLSSGGKGIGGGKGQQTGFNYFADTQMALCNGPIVGIGSV